MGKPQWTKEQQEVISLRDQNILVSAAAGSGKTAVLVERIIAKISRDESPCDIDRLLVVTFTKAAASEMRSRIGAALEERLQEEPGNEHIARQASLLHSAQITTIDSFCQWILRNYFHVIDLDPVYRVGDETDLGMMKQEILEELLEEKYLHAREEGDERFLNFTNIFSPGRTDKGIEDVVLTLYEKSTSYPFPEEWLIGLGEIYNSTNVERMEGSRWMGELLAYVRRCVGEYLGMARRALALCREDGGPEPYQEAVASDVDFLERLEEAETYCQWGELLGGFEAVKLKAIRGKKAEAVSAEKKSRVQSMREGYMKKGILELRKKFFFQHPEEMLSDMMQMREPMEELISLTLEFGRAFSDKKREEQILDFSDMEHLALEILTERGEDGAVMPSQTAKELQLYFDEILTDEYQDSNEVQELLLTSLCGGKGEKPYLFMVGDVKQSIYKFRMAKPEIFLHKYKTFSNSTEEGGMQREDQNMVSMKKGEMRQEGQSMVSMKKGEIRQEGQSMVSTEEGEMRQDSQSMVSAEKGENRRIDLSRNFRSRAGVLESANWIFEHIMQESLGGISYDEAARLVPGMTFEACQHPTGGKTELVLIEQKSDDITLERKSLEAAVIGEKIRGMVQGDQPMYVQGKHGYRPVTYGDVAILLRSVTGWAEEFVGVLNDMGIPAFADTRTGYFNSLEVETILNFLHVIDNPRQDIPLAAVLRSCLGELTDEEMAWIGTMEGDSNYLDQVESYLKEGEDAALREKLAQFMDRLHGYRTYGGTHSVYELLRKIYNETGYYQYMSAMPSGEKRRANLDILLQQSLEFARNGHRGIYGFARYIESLQKSEVDFGEAAVDGENANAVRIMTIHKSKGLEFPVVFVAGMGKRFNLMDARKSTVIDSEFGVGCDYVDLDLRVKQPTLAKKFIANQVVLGTLAEEIRVLYVALTRAKEKLVITGTASDVEKRLETWEERGGNMDFSALSSAQTYLDWIAPVVVGREGALADGDDLFRVEIVCPEDAVTAEVEEQKRELSLCRELREMDTTNVFDEEMREALDRQRNYCYPYQSEAELPVKISVSELKRQAIIRAVQMEEEEGLSWEAIARRVSEKSGKGRRDIDAKGEGLYSGEEIKYGKESSEKNLIVEELEIPRPAFLQEERELSGAARGTLYHMVMERFPYEEIRNSGGNWTQSEFDGYLEEMVAAGYMTVQERQVLHSGKFTEFLLSDIGRRMVQAHSEGNLRLEQPFMMGLPAREIYPEQDSDAMIIVQGIIDAFFFQGEEIVLVDYKTDSARPGQEEELVEKYRAQLDYYAKALEKLTGKNVAERWIYSFALGRELAC